MMEVIPAIDIIDGRCVRLSQGDYARSRVYGEPLEMARAFADAGAARLHLVDLDGAKASEPANLKVLDAIKSRTTLKVEWGGGIKSREALSSVLDAGADYAIIGSVAACRPELFTQWLEDYGHERIILGADVKGGKIAVKGWKESSAYGLSELLHLFGDSGLGQVICTDISKDGMLCGPDIAMYKALQEAFPGMQFTVSGGISCNADIAEVNEAGLPRVIVGKAYYEGKITLEELSSWWLNA